MKKLMNVLLKPSSSTQADSSKKKKDPKGKDNMRRDSSSGGDRAERASNSSFDRNSGRRASASTPTPKTGRMASTSPDEDEERASRGTPSAGINLGKAPSAEISFGVLGGSRARDTPPASARSAPGDESLMSAVPHSEASDSVREEGYLVNERDIPKLHLAAWNGWVHLIKKYLNEGPNVTDKFNRTPLHMACSRGHLEVVKELIANGASISFLDTNSKTPLMKAIERKHAEVVRYLVTSSQRPNVNAQDADMNSCLHLAVLSASPSGQGGQPADAASSPALALQVLNILLDADAVVERKNRDGCTGLHLATQTGFVDGAAELLKRGANVNAVDNHRRTPLMMACQAGNATMVDILVQNNANVSLQDDKGQSAEDYAILSNHSDLMDHLAGTVYGKPRVVKDVNANLKTSSVLDGKLGALVQESSFEPGYSAVMKPLAGGIQLSTGASGNPNMNGGGRRGARTGRASEDDSWDDGSLGLEDKIALPTGSKAQVHLKPPAQGIPVSARSQDTLANVPGADDWDEESQPRVNVGLGGLPSGSASADIGAAIADEVKRSETVAVKSMPPKGSLNVGMQAPSGLKMGLGGPKMNPDEDEENSDWDSSDARIGFKGKVPTISPPVVVLPGAQASIETKPSLETTTKATLPSTPSFNLAGPSVSVPAPAAATANANKGNITSSGFSSSSVSPAHSGAGLNIGLPSAELTGPSTLIPNAGLTVAMSERSKNHGSGPSSAAPAKATPAPESESESEASDGPIGKMYAGSGASTGAGIEKRLGFSVGAAAPSLQVNMKKENAALTANLTELEDELANARREAQKEADKREAAEREKKDMAARLDRMNRDLEEAKRKAQLAEEEKKKHELSVRDSLTDEVTRAKTRDLEMLQLTQQIQSLSATVAANKEEKAKFQEKISQQDAIRQEFDRMKSAKDRAEDERSRLERQLQREREHIAELEKHTSQLAQLASAPASSEQQAIAAAIAALNTSVPMGVGGAVVSPSPQLGGLGLNFGGMASTTSAASGLTTSFVAEGAQPSLSGATGGINVNADPRTGGLEFGLNDGLASDRPDAGFALGDSRMPSVRGGKIAHAESTNSVQVYSLQKEIEVLQSRCKTDNAKAIAERERLLIRIKELEQLNGTREEAMNRAALHHQLEVREYLHDKERLTAQLEETIHDREDLLREVSTLSKQLDELRLKLTDSNQETSEAREELKSQVDEYKQKINEMNKEIVRSDVLLQRIFENVRQFYRASGENEPLLEQLKPLILELNHLADLYNAQLTKPQSGPQSAENLESLRASQIMGPQMFSTAGIGLSGISPAPLAATFPGTLAPTNTTQNANLLRESVERLEFSLLGVAGATSAAPLGGTRARLNHITLPLPLPVPAPEAPGKSKKSSHASRGSRRGKKSHHKSRDSRSGSDAGSRSPSHSRSRSRSGKRRGHEEHDGNENERRHGHKASEGRTDSKRTRGKDQRDVVDAAGALQLSKEDMEKQIQENKILAENEALLLLWNEERSKAQQATQSKEQAERCLEEMERSVNQLASSSTVLPVPGTIQLPGALGPEMPQFAGGSTVMSVGRASRSTSKQRSTRRHHRHRDSEPVHDDQVDGGSGSRSTSRSHSSSNSRSRSSSQSDSLERDYKRLQNERAALLVQQQNEQLARQKQQQLLGAALSTVRDHVQATRHALAGQPQFQGAGVVDVADGARSAVSAPPAPLSPPTMNAALLQNQAELERITALRASRQHYSRDSAHRSRRNSHDSRARSRSTNRSKTELQKLFGQQSQQLSSNLSQSFSDLKKEMESRFVSKNDLEHLTNEFESSQRALGASALLQSQDQYGALQNMQTQLAVLEEERERERVQFSEQQKQREAERDRYIGDLTRKFQSNVQSIQDELSKTKKAFDETRLDNMTLNGENRKLMDMYRAKQITPTRPAFARATSGGFSMGSTGYGSGVASSSYSQLGRTPLYSLGTPGSSAGSSSEYYSKLKRELDHSINLHMEASAASPRSTALGLGANPRRETYTPLPGSGFKDLVGQKYLLS